MPRVIALDVMETLLDVGALDPTFQGLFGDASARQQWFAQMLQSAFVATITDSYTAFGAIGMAALTMVAERRGVTLTEEDRQRIREGITHLPAHPDVRPGLERLRDAGFRLVALTNSTEEVARAQVASAGLRDFFERVFSADTVRRLKPAPEPYRMVADQLGVPIAQIRLVAAHAWDVAGAQRAGCAAAFVARPGQVLDPLAARPDVVGADMGAVAEQIITAELAR